MKNRRVVNGLSYLLVAGIGAAGGWFVKQRGAREGDVGGETRREIPKPKDGRELLDAFVAASKDPVKSDDERFDEFRKIMEVSSDPAADFRKRLAEMEAAGLGRQDDGKRLTELGVLLGQWVDIDPKAALAFLAEAYSAGGLAKQFTENHLWRVAKNAVAQKGMMDFVGALPAKPDLFMLTSRSVLEDVAKRASLADLEWLKANAPAYFTDGYAGKNLGREWPVERREELLEALDPKSAAAAVAAMMGRMDGAGGEWVLQKLKDGGFSEAVVKEMAVGDLGWYYQSIKGVSIEQRLEIMGALGTLNTIGGDRAKNEMIFNGIRNCFFGKETDDSLYGLRHGTTTAAQVLALAAEKMPDPGKHAAEYSSQMFRTLAEENLPAAMEIISGMSPAEQEKQKAYAARWWFREVDPDDFLKLTQELNATGDDSTKAMMQDAWNDKARFHIDRYGAAYLEWISALPAGADKTQALRSVVAAGRDTRLATRARNLLNGQP